MLEELEFDEWAVVNMGNTQYDLNIFPDEHGDLCVTLYPLEYRKDGTAFPNTLNAVAGGKLEIYSLKRIKDGI